MTKKKLVFDPLLCNSTQKRISLHSTEGKSVKGIILCDSVFVGVCIYYYIEFIHTQIYTYIYYIYYINYIFYIIIINILIYNV